MDRGGRAPPRLRSRPRGPCRRGPLLRRARRLPHRGRDRSRRRALPGLPAPAAATAGPSARPEPPTGARRRHRPDPRRPGRARSFRHPTRRPAARRRGRAGRPRAPLRPARGRRGGARLAVGTPRPRALRGQSAFAVAGAPTSPGAPAAAGRATRNSSPPSVAARAAKNAPARKAS